MDTNASLLTSDASRSSSWKLSSVVRLTLAAGAAIALVVTGVHFIRSSKSDKPSLQGTQLQAFSVSELSTVYKDASLNVRFEGFMLEHGKTYATSEERALRFEIFKSNARFIEEQNSKGLDYTLGENAFMDLTWDEFKQQYLGVDMDWFQQYTNNGDVDTELIVQKDSLPKTFDEWRPKGCVTDVKDQGPCGSCWAFSATGSMEGIYCAAGLGQVNLSEQQLVDCARKEGNQGCRGGLMSQAFDYVLHNNGLCSQDDYPYTARDGTCKSSGCKNAMTISSWFSVPKGNEAALMAGIVKRGPIAVAIEANPSFQFYRSGVFTERCGMSLNHGVLAVGYGEEHGKEYFIVKNSWGSRWGEQGYIRMGRGNRFSNHGQCGIQVWPVFPRVN